MQPVITNFKAQATRRTAVEVYLLCHKKKSLLPTAYQIHFLPQTVEVQLVDYIANRMSHFLIVLLN